MKLYHGSNIEIIHIDLFQCRPYKDFGRGFYLTSIYEKAQQMAERVARIYGNSPVVTAFEFNEALCQHLNIKRFGAPNAEWAKFVLNNRNHTFTDFQNEACNFDNKYDIVIGPVADDDMVILFRQFTSGLIDIQTLVKAMKYKSPCNQYAFQTPRAIQQLTKVSL